MLRASVRADLPVLRTVDGHHAEVPFLLTADMFGGLPIEVAGGDISDKVGKPVAELHRHEVAELYLLVSPSPGGARIEVTVDGATIEASSPSVVHVPAGALHRFVTLEAEPGSCCFGILIAGPLH